MIIILYQFVCFLLAFSTRADGGMRCADYLNSCSKYKTSCDNKILRKYCRITCLKCTPEPQVYANCRDKHTQCYIMWNEGRCRGSKSDHEYSRRMCGLTCGFCRRSKKRECGVAALRRVDEPQLASPTIDNNFVMSEMSARKGYYPWQAAIYYNDDYHCGGVLISKRFLLSSASCFKPVEENRKNFTVVLGEHDRYNEEGTEQYLKVKKVVVHNRFELAQQHDDIALIEMSNDAKLTKYIAPICLPTAEEELRPGSTCTVTGWSRMYNSGDAAQTLQEITVPIIDLPGCKRQHTFGGRTVSHEMICSGYGVGNSFKSTCLRDSGQPLSCKDDTGIWKVYGILMPTCHGLQSYNVFTKVSSYWSWIDQHMS